MKNLKMNDNTYKLRRAVMAYIYEARNLALVPAACPRITVRITENSGNTLGRASMGHNEVWICERTVKDYTPLQLRHVVFHELGHAWFAKPHSDKCPLMGPVIKRTTRAKQDEIMRKWHDETMGF